MNATKTLFTNAFNAATGTLEFNPAWENGTEYFDHLATKQEFQSLVPVGKVYKSVDSVSRRIVIVGTALGNIVVFDRFAVKVVEDREVFVTNINHKLKDFIYVNGALSFEMMYDCVGANDGGAGNAGQRLNRMIATLVKSKLVVEVAELNKAHATTVVG